MPKIKVYNNGYITNKDKVESFVERIDTLLMDLQCYDIDTEELERCKEGIIRSNCYGQRDIWFIEDTEEKIQQYINNEDDLPF